MAYPKEFSIVLFLLLVGLCAYLLCVGKITGQAYVLSLPLCALSIAVIHNLDVIERFQIKTSSIEASADFQRIRNEVYAKATEVQHMTESVAGLIAENVATSNRFGGSSDPDPIAQEVRYREKLRQTLIGAKTSKGKMDEILAPLEKSIPADLRSAILQASLDVELKRGLAPKDVSAFQAQLQAALESTPPLTGLERAVQIIHQKGASSPELTKCIQRYTKFLTEDQL